MRKAAYFTVATLIVVLASGPHASASSTRQYGLNEPKRTTLETSTGRRLVIVTDGNGTIVKEERSGREVWRSISDRHDAKVKEYVRSGAKVQSQSSGAPR